MRQTATRKLELTNHYEEMVHAGKKQKNNKQNKTKKTRNFNINEGYGFLHIIFV